MVFVCAPLKNKANISLILLSSFADYFLTWNLQRNVEILGVHSESWARQILCTSNPERKSISKCGGWRLLKSEHLHADSKATNHGGFSLKSRLHVREAEGCCLSRRSSPTLEQRGLSSSSRAAKAKSGLVLSGDRLLLLPAKSHVERVCILWQVMRQAVCWILRSALRVRCMPGLL